MNKILNRKNVAFAKIEMKKDISENKGNYIRRKKRKLHK
jgi:hypothetical protein